MKNRAKKPAGEKACLAGRLWLQKTDTPNFLLKLIKGVL